VEQDISSPSLAEHKQGLLCKGREWFQVAGWDCVPLQVVLVEPQLVEMGRRLDVYRSNISVTTHSDQ